MSKVLKKALRFSLVPAILIIATKVIGILVLNDLYDLNIMIDNDINHFFSTQILLSSQQDSVFLNSVTDSIALISLLIPLSYMIIKFLIVKESKSNPRTVVKLTKANLLKWVTKEDVTFLKVFIWTAFFWMISALSIVNSIKGQSYLIVGVMAGVATILASWGVLRVFEIDSDKVYPE